MYGEIFSVIANCQISHFAIFYQFYQYLTVQEIREELWYLMYLETRWVSAKISEKMPFFLLENLPLISYILPGCSMPGRGG